MARTTTSTAFRQSGVIPFRRSASGMEVLLITSRTRGRWIVPKGSLETDMTAAESAELEAWEEAGVEGRLLPELVGQYITLKGQEQVEVDLFLLEVEDVYDEWPEQHQRRRIWASVEAATRLVDAADLAAVISRLPALVG